MFIADFDGDGLQDIMVVDQQGFNIYKNHGDIEDSAFNVEGDRGSFSWNSTINSGYSMKMGDFNGDGLPDFILSKKGVAFGEWYLAINNGHLGFDLKPLPGIVACDDMDDNGLDNDKDNCMVTDFNNDGKSDVIITNANYNWKHNIWGDYWKVFDRVTTYWYESTGEGLKLAHPPSVSTNEIDAYNRFSVIGDFNGDGRPDLMNYGYNCYKDTAVETSGWKLYTSANNKYEGGMVTAISDGMKRKTTISYSSLSARDNYTARSYQVPPLANLSQPLYVVKRTDNTGGVLGKLSTKYSYADAIVYPLKGFLGFGQVTALDSAKQTAVDNYYTFSKTAGNRTFYMPYLTKTVTSLNNAPIGQIEMDYVLDTLGGKHIWVYQKLAVARDFLKNTRDSSITVYNADGNLISSVIKNLDDASSAIVSTRKITYNNYSDRIPSDGNPYPNAPDNIVTELTHSDAQGKKSTDTTALVYNTDGTINQKISFAGRSKSVTNTYTYYPNGNINTESVSSAGLLTHISTSTYDATGRFPATRTNTLGHKTTYRYDNFGRLLSKKDINNAITSFTYDQWGKLIQETSPDGILTLYHTVWANGGDAPADALYYSDTNYDAKFKGATYFDVAGNVLRKVTTGYQGAKYYNDTKYYAAGEVVEASESYQQGSSTTRKSTYHYDHLNRLTTLTQPNNVTVNYTHNANKDSIKYSTGELYTKTYDAAGLLKQSTDPGGTINYFYNSLGKTRRIESPGSTIDMNFNIYGLQDTLKDPNAGKTFYTYNAYGELISQTDPKGTTSLTYDTLGRIKTKTIGTLTTTYTYDKGTRALGTLTSVSSSNGASESYTYSKDGLCRATGKTRSKGAESFTYHYAYDAKGRVDTMSYPAGFAIKYKYNEYDDLTAIYNTKNTSVPIWKMDGVNLKGQLQNATYGNGMQITYGYDTDNRLNRIYVPGIMDFNYNFNDKQQLVYRDEKYDNGNGVMQGLHEVFTYDGVNRLQTATGAVNLQMTYPTGVNDRIASKSDAGAYVYNNLTNHRLDTVKGVTGYLPLNHTISFTTEHMVDTVKENGKTLSLSYGNDNQRFKMDYNENNVLKYTRYYDDLYEKEVQANGAVRHLNYVYTPSGLTAIDVQKTGRDTMYYVYSDYLGSLRCITDSSHNIKQRLGYDAWGNRRDPITGIKLATTNGLLFARGFTGHEHLDELGLINMNGRMYDPALGIFISPDNFVQTPDFTQNYNRYAYCFNNPLMYSDPSGENINWIIGGVLGGISNVRNNQSNIHNFTDWFVYYNIGNLAGSTSAAIGGWSGWGGNSIASGLASGFTKGFITNTLNSLYKGSEGMESLSAGLQSGTTSGAWGAASGAVSMGFGALMNISWTNLQDYDGLPPHQYRTITLGQYLGLGDVGSFGGSNDYLGEGVQEIAGSQNTGLLTKVHVISEVETPEIYYSTMYALSSHPQWSTLTYNGGGKAAQINRYNACKGVTMCGGNNSRDEFPYASTTQGGTGAYVNCVPVSEQQIQALHLRTLYSGMKAGDQFRVLLMPRIISPVTQPVPSPSFPPLLVPVFEFLEELIFVL
jgi:RHS repeat-associated protein